MKSWIASSVLAVSLLGATGIAQAEEYNFDIKGAHAFVQFRVKHLGYSWLYGRFNKFDGKFSYDEAKPEAASVEATIDTTSVDSNHAERDKHLRASDFLDVEKFPEAKFVSTSYTPAGENKAKLKGNLTLHGVTKEIEMDVDHIGAGKDPWGGFRRGFEGTVTFSTADFNIEGVGRPMDVEMTLSVEGIRQ